MPTVPFADRAMFTTRFPDMEVIQLSDLDDPDRMSVRPDKLQGNLIKATNRICAKIGVAPPTATADLAGWHPAFAEWCCDIARDYLDEGYGFRERVQKSGEEAWDEIESLVKGGQIESLIPPNYGSEPGVIIGSSARMSLRIV